MNMTAMSAGLTLRKVGGDGRFAGSLRREAVIAACTSSAAPSIFRSRSNCSTIEDVPRPDCEVMVVMAGMVANCRSSGAVTDAAIVSGLAPGRVAVTAMVGKSTRGSAATGSWR